jgi:hypothetical protein
MEKALSGDLLKILIVVLVGSIGFYMLLVKVTKKILGGSKSVRRKQNIYLLVGAFIFGLAGCTGYSGIFGDPATFMVMYQVFFFALGVLHYYLITKWFPVPLAEQKSFALNFVFSLALCLFGFLLFVFAFGFFNREGYQYLMASSILCFMVPLLVYHSFLKAISIPPPVVKRWFYPVHQQVAEPDDIQLKNMFIVTFRFQKKPGDAYFTSFRAKAPAGMDFGNLFYYFINDYNERNPEDRIEFLDDRGNPQGWTFYKKGKWFNLSAPYLDADQTVVMNGLKENDVIICHRLYHSAAQKN